ncbi:Poly(A) RNA polymerase cid14 [Grifola frondosa]|uniref:polynucleotide adenylyltransferase n=1 Tax=Grifola frondosa TaxID=5627 RepID=A0A1C7LV20_GRIFR|nr:Poly(A) RNA polymerase cid14 [Grifola frondosa]
MSEGSSSLHPTLLDRIAEAPNVSGPSNAVLPITEKPSTRRRKSCKRKRAPNDTANVETPSWHTPWNETLGMTQYESKAQRLHDEIVAFVTYILPTTQERRARELVIARVRELARRRFNNAAIDTFGSVAQNLYLPEGDTDLVITTYHEVDQSAKKRALFQLSALIKNSAVAHDVQVIHRARVPLISFKTVSELGSFKVDISLNATDGVKAIPIIREYLDKMPALRYLILIVKSLLSKDRLNSASDGGLSSYAVTCLVISFLQVNPQNVPTKFIENPMESESLGRLLMDFLDYYGNTFPYSTSYISITEGKLLSKESKGWASTTHPENLCIQCPINPDNDVGRPTSKIGHIRTLFREAHQALQNYPFSDANGNILGAILGVSNETLAHRQHLREIVESGSLERTLMDTVPLQPTIPRNRHSNAGRSRKSQPYILQSSYGLRDPHLNYRADSLPIYGGPSNVGPVRSSNRGGRLRDAPDDPRGRRRR